MQSNFYPAQTRGISDHFLYESGMYDDFVKQMFHMGSLDGAYEDEQTWRGAGLPDLHSPMQPINMDGIEPSWNYRYWAQSWTMGTVIPLEAKRDDLYNIIHRFFPMVGGEWAISYLTLKNILAAQFYGVYGFQSGTSVPYMADGVSLYNTAHDTAKTDGTHWSNTPATAIDLSIAGAMLMRAALRTQKRPSAAGTPLNNKLAKVMVHPNQELVARQIFKYGTWEAHSPDRTPNYLADDNVDILVNPYFEYGGGHSATYDGLTAYNAWVGWGQTHYCHWKERSDLETFSDFKETILADVITALERFAYGATSALGTYGCIGP